MFFVRYPQRNGVLFSKKVGAQGKNMQISILLEIQTVDQLAKVFGALKPFLVSTPIPTTDQDDLCPKHGAALKVHTRNGKTWRSHPLPDGGWCNGR
jgi:hypothetical protein